MTLLLASLAALVPSLAAFARHEWKRRHAWQVRVGAGIVRNDSSYYSGGWSGDPSLVSVFLWLPSEARRINVDTFKGDAEDYDERFVGAKVKAKSMAREFNSVAA